MKIYSVRFIFIILFFSSLCLFITGITSEICLGDEVYHYRFAKNIFQSGRRATFDSIYSSPVDTGAYFYNTEPFWHIALAILWKIIGHPSLAAAQFYQVIYYIFLLILVYLFGKRLYGPEEGFYSMFLLATMPAVILYSIVLYIDIAIAVFSLLGLFFIYNKKYFFAGLILGIMYLTKKNGMLLLPSFLGIIIFYNYKLFNLAQKIKTIFLFILPGLIIVILDGIWRSKNLLINYIDYIYIITTRIINNLIHLDLFTKDKMPSSLINPINLVQYLGVSLIFLFIIYFFYKKFQKKDFILWISVISFFILYIPLYKLNSDIRYIMPIVPLLSIIGGKTLTSLNKKSLKFIIILICIIQFFATIYYLSIKRIIPEQLKEGFSYLKQNSLHDSLVIYIESVILEKAERRYTWTEGLHGKLEKILWGNDNDVFSVLKETRVDYIAVKKSRIYDDSKVKHFAAYPKSFVERLPKFNFLKLVFDNKEISIWKINS